jgi:hypothetical protein
LARTGTGLSTPTLTRHGFVRNEPPGTQNYSIRKPLIARAITSCWISDVPSKIVWLTVPGFLGIDE